jgi:hypothetical protein
MNINKVFLKNAGIFLLFLIGFWIISMWYFSPAMDGKVLKQGDMQQVKLMVSVADSVKAKTGISPNWNDRVFSGMPSNLISGIPQGSLLLKYRILEAFGIVKSPFTILFLSMLSMFVLMQAVRVEKWLSAAAAVGYAFMTFSISSYEAGHVTKVLAMSVMPGVVAGLIMLSQRRYLWGGMTLGLFFAMVINYFHYQIAYYTGIIMAIYLVIELISSIKKKSLVDYAKILGITVAVSLIGVLSCIGKIQDTMQYSKATMRGGSAVASEVPKNGPKETVNAKGLDIDYAFSWSYGIDESLTLLVPRYKGGSSDEPVPENDFGAERLPTYFGDLQFTSGPVYMGAIMMFLFVFSVVFAFQWKRADSNNEQAQLTYKLMLFSLITFAVSLMMSWGKHFFINEWLFNYLPFYNKFRTPMMTLVIAQVVVPFFGLYGLYQLMTANLPAGFDKKVIKSAAIVAASLLGIVILGTSNSDMVGLSDKEILKSSGQGAVDVIKSLRDKLVWGDIWRTLGFVALAFAMIYGAVSKQLKPIIISGILLVAITLDMVTVSQRYLNESNWQEKEEEEAIIPTKYDEMVMRDNREGARVFDLRYNPFNDNHAAPFHKNIGGYHPAKLSRYQDVISYCITPNGGQLNGDFITKNNALDMLNCKYVLSRDQKSGAEEVFPRMNPLGHAWFVDSVKIAEKPKDALNMINTVNIRKNAVVEKTEESKCSAFSFVTDSTSTIKQLKYSTDSIQYASNSKSAGFAVFSEVYYNEANGGWKVYIDGKETKAVRTNYILRGVEIPAGQHQILWVYVPSDRSLYFNIEMASSGLILLLFLGLIAKQLFTKPEEENLNA